MIPDPVRIRSILAEICPTSKVSGSSSHNPSCTATSVPWPRPVLAREPYSITVTDTTSLSLPDSERLRQHIRAAFHGPSVWELEGPTPTLNMSKTDIGSCGMTMYFDIQQGLRAKRSGASRSNGSRPHIIRQASLAFRRGHCPAFPKATAQHCSPLGITAHSAA